MSTMHTEAYPRLVADIGGTMHASHWKPLRV